MPLDLPPVTTPAQRTSNPTSQCTTSTKSDGLNNQSDQSDDSDNDEPDQTIHLRVYLVIDNHLFSYITEQQVLQVMYSQKFIVLKFVLLLCRTIHFIQSRSLFIIQHNLPDNLSNSLGRPTVLSPTSRTFFIISNNCL